MVHASVEESLDDVLAAAKKSGHPVTPEQLHRWQQAGLIPAPRQRGLGRGRGTVAVYPGGTARQVMAAHHLIKQEGSIKAALWQLWWDGHCIEEVRIRSLLAEQLEKLKKGRKEMLRLKESEEEEPWRLLERWARDRVNVKVLGRMRRRVGKERFATVAMLFLDIVYGTLDRQLFELDAQLFAKALGTGLSAPRLSTTAFADQAYAASRLMDPRRLKEVFNEVSAQDSHTARGELRMLLDSLNLLSDWAEIAIGLTVDRELLAEPLLGMRIYRFLVWLSVRRLDGFRQGFDQFLALAEALRTGKTVKVVGDSLEVDPNV